MIVIYLPYWADKVQALNIHHTVNVGTEACWLSHVVAYKGEGPSACVWIVPGTEG